MCHRLVYGDLTPWRMVSPLYFTVALFFVNCASQPALQSWLMDIRDVVSDGMMWAVDAIGGSFGWRVSCVVWLEEVMVPSGRVTVIDVFGVWCLVVVFAVRK